MAEIQCAACGADTLAVREPLYDGFTKVGEQFVCSSCGHVYTDETDLPLKTTATPAVFTDADRSEDSAVFKDDEHQRLCRYCRHYVLNPFTQWCGLHHREVEATDSCDKFEQLEDSAESGD